MVNVFADYFYIDTRSLNLFRRLLSGVVFIDIIIRFTDLTAHYTNEGVLPLQALFANYWNHWFWSAAVVSDSKALLYFIFIAILTAAFLLFIGYRSRLMTVICWAGILSVQNRNPIIYQGGDDLLRMMLFWSVFLPLNNPGPRKINNVATMALLCQVLFALFFSGLFKGAQEWWHEGSAIYYALSLDQIARPVGLWLAHHYELTVVLTRCVYVIEIALLPLFLMPLARETIRLVIVIMLATLFTSIMLCMMIGVFPLCYIAALGLFIPHTFWNRLEEIGVKGKFENIFRALRVGYARQRDMARYHLHWVVQSGLGFMFTLVIIWNITTLPASPIHFPYGLDPLMFSLRLNQSWGMFAPTVLKEDGWLVCKAELNDKSVIDLNAADLKLSYDKPAYVLSKFKNDRWRKYTEQLYVGSNRPLRHYYADYLIRKWDKGQLSEDKKIKNLAIIFMLEVSKPHQEITSLEKVFLYETDIDPYKVNTP